MDLALGLSWRVVSYLGLTYLKPEAYLKLQFGGLGLGALAAYSEKIEDHVALYSVLRWFTEL